jgi:hypothetical protein
MTQPILPVVNSITRPDPFDSWGPLQLPTSPGQAFTTVFDGWGKGAGSLSQPPSDGALACCLDFLAVLLETDQFVQAAWQSAMYGGGEGRVIRKVYLHDPREVAFNTTDLPALYMWRESATQGWIADDYLRDNTLVKGLWIFPIPGKQEAQRVRSVFANVLPKAMATGIERGRTPGWVQPGDPDPSAAAQGSLFYTYAGFDEFTLVSWAKASVDIRNPETARGRGTTGDYYALDLSFRLVECQVYGIGREPPFYPDDSLEDTVQTEDPIGSIATAWAASTFYGPAAIVVPITPNGFFYVGLFANTKSGATEPTFPTTPGATVTDGTQTWTCVGRIDGASITGVFAP